MFGQGKKILIRNGLVFREEGLFRKGDLFLLGERIAAEDLYRAVPLRTEEKMTIGYIKKKQVPLSSIAEKYLEELKAFI